VVDEPLELFREVLRRIGEQAPDETIVVINGPQPPLEDVCSEFAGQLTQTWTPVASTRNAVRIGVEMASGEVVVLLGSDTIWTEGALAELLKPFADPSRGRRDHQAAHPRPRVQPPHPVGGLAGEQGPAEPSRPSRTRHHRHQARTYDPNHEPARPAM
jgi:cellulose synthase/poly-beta-1,6-N-acetylglucosamine synthase-like glycosyltransferase